MFSKSRSIKKFREPCVEDILGVFVAYKPFSIGISIENVCTRMFVTKLMALIAKEGVLWLIVLL